FLALRIGEPEPPAGGIREVPRHAQAEHEQHLVVDDRKALDARRQRAPPALAHLAVLAMLRHPRGRRRDLRDRRSLSDARRLELIAEVRAQMLARALGDRRALLEPRGTRTAVDVALALERVVARRAFYRDAFAVVQHRHDRTMPLAAQRLVY